MERKENIRDEKKQLRRRKDATGSKRANTEQGLALELPQRKEEVQVPRAQDGQGEDPEEEEKMVRLSPWLIESRWILEFSN